MSRILVVDDDRDMRALIGTYLEAAGHAVEFASDGQVALEAVSRRVPDLILTDFQMPRMDGFGLFNAIRSHPRASRVPVVMVTAHNSREMMQKALSLGIDEFLGKPITKDDLLRVVAKGLKPQAPAEPAAPGVPPTQSEFFGSVMCCRIRSLEGFAMALKKEELQEVLDKFAGDVAATAQDEGGWMVRFDHHHLVASFEDKPGAAGAHAKHALRCALRTVLVAQRLKPWLATRFPGRGFPEFVVALGVHSGRIQCTLPAPGAVAALHGDSVNIGLFLVESILQLGWSVAATRAAAVAAEFAFVAGRGAQVHEPRSGGTLKLVEVAGLEPPAASTTQVIQAVTLIEAAVSRNATLASYAAAVPKKAGSPAPAPASDPLAGRSVVLKLADNGIVAVYLVQPGPDVAQQILKTVRVNDDRKKHKRPNLLKFVDQYTTFRTIDHPNIARVIDHGLSETHLFVVQEYCSGGDLRNLIAQGMAAADAVRVLLRIAGGLKLAHQKGFVHGDLKPSNVMIREDGSFAIVDFALARAVEYAAGEGEAGVLLRAPGYLSPEIINGQPADVRSDIYTLGLLLHEMLTGQRAYASPDLSRVMRDQLQAPVPVLPSPHERFQPLLAGLMAKLPEQRFASVQEAISFMMEARLQG